MKEPSIASNITDTDGCLKYLTLPKILGVLSMSVF